MLHLAHTRKHPEHLLHRAHLAHLLQLLEEVLERELILCDLLGDLARFVFVEGLLRLLDEREDVAEVEMRLAMRSGWNGSRSSSPSPVDA